MVNGPRPPGEYRVTGPSAFQLAEIIQSSLEHRAGQPHEIALTQGCYYPDEYVPYLGDGKKCDDTVVIVRPNFSCLGGRIYTLRLAAVYERADLFDSTLPGQCAKSWTRIDGEPYVAIKVAERDNGLEADYRIQREWNPMALTARYLREVFAPLSSPDKAPSIALGAQLFSEGSSGNP